MNDHLFLLDIRIQKIQEDWRRFSSPVTFYSDSYYIYHK